MTVVLVVEPKPTPPPRRVRCRICDCSWYISEKLDRCPNPACRESNFFFDPKPEER